MSKKSTQILENLKSIRQKEPDEHTSVTAPIASNMGADRIYGLGNDRVQLINQNGSTYKGKIDRRRITEQSIDGSNFYSHVFETADGRWFDRAGLPCAKPKNLVKHLENSEEEPTA
jgi:hypothetical protein